MEGRTRFIVNIRVKWVLLSIFFLLLFPSDSYPSQSGFKKHIENYRPKDSNRLWSNRIITQDRKGIIYAGNINYITRKGSLQQYDGVAWRAFEGFETGVQSLAVDSAGNIYTGGDNEFGFLSPDTNGMLRYRPLADPLKNFGYVNAIRIIQNKAYFISTGYICQLDIVSRKKNEWPSNGNGQFQNAFSVNGTLWINRQNCGLIRLENGRFEKIPGGERFNGKHIVMMAPFHNGTILMGTRNHGFFLLNGSGSRPFPTAVDNYLNNNRLAHGIRLSSDFFALATSYGGLVIMTPGGQLHEIFTKSDGLQDEEIHYVFEDFQGNLWLALEHGISKIEYASPISINDNLALKPYCLVKHKGTLYAGTERGLYYLTAEGNFKHVPGTSGVYFSLISTGRSIFAATFGGVMRIDNRTITKVTGDISYCLLQSGTDPKRIWAGGRSGLVSLYKQNGKWKKERRLEKITQNVETIVEDRQGSLWLGINSGKNYTEKITWNIRFENSETIRSPLPTAYDTSRIVFHHNLIWVFKAAGHVIFSTEKGLFRFDKRKKIFVPDLTFGNRLAGSTERKGMARLIEDKDKNTWIRTKTHILMARPLANGTYSILSKPFQRIQSYYWFPVYPDPTDDITWIGGKGRLIRYDLKIKKNYELPFHTLIRKVTVNSKPVLGKEQVEHLILSYNDRSLGFEFAAPFFEDEAGTRYSCMLDGYETDWSPLRWETRKDYTNLEPGTYVFKARAENIYGNRSSSALFKFKILLPWYRTWWAFLSYAIVLLVLTYLVVKWRRSIKLEKEKLKLEEIVKERTGEIEKKSLQLQKQSEKLKELDNVKSRFFANISHEFRTPLTLIMGPLEQMLDQKSGKEDVKWLNLMMRNSQRLLNLINQLLELSKLDSGKIKPQKEYRDINLFLKGIIATFEPVTDKNHLDLTFTFQKDEIFLNFDPRMLEDIMLNLLSNAVKFTPPGGKIIVSTHAVPAADPNPGWLEIIVSDTGMGVPDEQLVHIFDRFYQSDHTYEHHQKGSGIGLALARELVELHGGRIEARKRREDGRGDKGTDFIIRLPLGHDLLAPGEITRPGEQSFRHKRIDEMPHFFIEESNGTEISENEKKAEQIPVRREKIIVLVVEDNPDVRIYIKTALEPYYCVLEAEGGKEGIAMARKIIPDIIVSDIMMPGTDGYSLCRVLKKDVKTSHIPIILLTAKASEESIVKGLDTGADDYITKPFSTKVLCSRIKNLVNLRRQLQLKRKKQMAFQPMEITVSSVDETFYKELQDVIEKNMENDDFNVDQLGKKLYMSRATLYRKIMALTGESPQLYIRSYRLMRAAQLLKANYGNVNEVAYKVGFSKPAYFSQCFKEKFHRPPSSFLTPGSG